MFLVCTVFHTFFLFFFFFFWIVKIFYRDVHILYILCSSSLCFSAFTSFFVSFFLSFFNFIFYWIGILVHFSVVLHFVVDVG